MSGKESNGNMYSWVTKTYNPVAGFCPHDCLYCYVNSLRERNRWLKEKYSGGIRLVDKEMKKNLGKGKTWFVCSCIDLFAVGVTDEIIEKVLEHCREYPDNTYLFQTKNPKRLLEFMPYYPDNTILGTTIETNKKLPITKAPSPYKRYKGIKWVREFDEYPVMVSVEPILNFDFEKLVKWIYDIKPSFVSIGADSKGNDLPEPSSWKVEKLIKALEKFTVVKLKKNLKRIAYLEGYEYE